VGAPHIYVMVLALNQTDLCDVTHSYVIGLNICDMAKYQDHQGAPVRVYRT